MPFGTSNPTIVMLIQRDNLRIFFSAVLLFLMSSTTAAKSPSIIFSNSYFNSSNYDTINQHYGIYGGLSFGKLYLMSGVEYLHIMTDASIHDDNDDLIFTNRETFRIPISIGYSIRPSPKVKLFTEFGYSIYISDSLSDTNSAAIENESGIFDESFISDYSESLQSSPYAKIGLTVFVNKYLQISAAKHLEMIRNKISYTYLDSVSTSKEVEFTYGPLVVSLSFTF